jgi:hypothetical protein
MRGGLNWLLLAPGVDPAELSITINGIRLVLPAVTRLESEAGIAGLLEAVECQVPLASQRPSSTHLNTLCAAPHDGGGRQLEPARRGRAALGERGLPQPSPSVRARGALQARGVSEFLEAQKETASELSHEGKLAHSLTTRLRGVREAVRKRERSMLGNILQMQNVAKVAQLNAHQQASPPGSVCAAPPLAGFPCVLRHLRGSVGRQTVPTNKNR